VSRGGTWILAAGPLPSESLVRWISGFLPQQSLFFYDAIAPIVACDSIDMTVAFAADRWHPEKGDYINCPFTEEQYYRFRDELVGADTAAARRFEDAAWFEACLPLEVAAARSADALRFGPMRPVGIVDPRTGKRPFAVCQLRSENAHRSSFNLVGFQTRLSQPEQRRVFRMIPGLENAEFYRYGSIHRNTYLDSPRLLDRDLSFIKMPDLFLAGQLSGNEGYTESIATGHCAALFAIGRLHSIPVAPPPATTALGSLLRHITGPSPGSFVPTNFNFGLLEPVSSDGAKKMPREHRKRVLCSRAQEDLSAWKSACLGRLVFE
jgi:methylenetetrahydrofolate--tRNA-(uracil-5-)-methyltransferase